MSVSERLIPKNIGENWRRATIVPRILGGTINQLNKERHWEEHVFSLDSTKFNLVKNTRACELFLALFRSHQVRAGETYELIEIPSERRSKYQITFNDDNVLARLNYVAQFYPVLEEMLTRNNHGQAFGTETILLANLFARLNNSNTAQDVERFTRAAFYNSLSRTLTQTANQGVHQFSFGEMPPSHSELLLVKSVARVTSSLLLGPPPEPGQDEWLTSSREIS